MDDYEEDNESEDEDLDQEPEDKWIKKYVSSSVIRAISYNYAFEEMIILFNSGSEYVYYYVNDDTYEALISASSIGSYFYWYVRLVYQFARLK